MSRLLPASPPHPTATVEGRTADRALDSPVLRAVTVLGRRAAAAHNEE
jgi:hypothetical protein